MNSVGSRATTAVPRGVCRSGKQANLRSFYNELIQTFPPMNGPGAPTEEAWRRDAELLGRMSDYSVGTLLVYGAFSWSQARTARDTFTELAAKHEVAVAMVSDDGSILRS